MRVIVDDAVFDRGTPRLRITELLFFATTGRHRLIVKRGPCFSRWLDALSDDTREEYERAFGDSEQSESTEPSDHEIRVGPGGVTVDDAFERLGRPFLLYVENEKSDRAFLEAVASAPYRERLLRMHRRGWLVFRSHGGISHIRALVVRDLGEFPEDAWRMFAIFDSDAELPRQPHADARTAASECTRHGVSFRMLSRSAIENYLTRSALEAWAAEQREVARHMDRIGALYGAWFTEDPTRRHHFPMKEGLKRRCPPALFADIPPDVRRLLHDAFGSGVAAAFTPEQVREIDLRAEGAWDELSEIVEALVRRMR